LDFHTQKVFPVTRIKKQNIEIFGNRDGLSFTNWNISITATQEECRLDNLLPATNGIVCIICGKEVNDPDLQLCEEEPCIEQFRSMYLQAV
jgi:hypothetical protein